MMLKHLLATMLSVVLVVHGEGHLLLDGAYTADLRCSQLRW
jgi:hypothetical protein